MLCNGLLFANENNSYKLLQDPAWRDPATQNIMDITVLPV